MQFNFLIILIAALIPLIVGFVWYNPKVFGTTWMNVAGITPEKMQGGNMAVIFGVTFLLSFFLAFAVQFMVIPQYSVYSVLEGDPGLKDPTSAVSMMINDFMGKYGNNFRTFKHGAFHGVISAMTVALPILGINALFERKGFKYIAVNIGYWIVTLALMGGIICKLA